LVVQQGGFRIAMAMIFGISALVFVLEAHAFGHDPSGEQSVGGFNVGGLGLAGVWLILWIRAVRSGVTMTPNRMKVRRIFWSRSVAISDVASFGLEANVLYSAWWGSARLKDGRRVRLPFCARSSVKDSPKNEPTQVLLAQLDHVRWAAENA
jgi:hypothetical protein